VSAAIYNVLTALRNQIYMARANTTQIFRVWKIEVGQTQSVQNKVGELKDSWLHSTAGITDGIIQELSTVWN
jgi:hypothetical protein